MHGAHRACSMLAISSTGWRNWRLLAVPHQSLRERHALLSVSQCQPPPSVGGGAAAAARVAACQLLRPHFINRVFATVCSPASRFLANREARIFPSPLPPPAPFVFLHPAAARLCHESFQAQQYAYCLLARFPALS